MVRISPSGPITTPEPLRSRPASRPSGRPRPRTCTPTTAALARVSASNHRLGGGGWGVAAWARASSEVEGRRARGGGRCAWEAPLRVWGCHRQGCAGNEAEASAGVLRFPERAHTVCRALTVNPLSSLEPSGRSFGQSGARNRDASRMNCVLAMHLKAVAPPPAATNSLPGALGCRVCLLWHYAPSQVAAGQSHALAFLQGFQVDLSSSSPLFPAVSLVNKPGQFCSLSAAPLLYERQRTKPSDHQRGRSNAGGMESNLAPSTVGLVNPASRGKKSRCARAISAAWGRSRRQFQIFGATKTRRLVPGTQKQSCSACVRTGSS